MYQYKVKGSETKPNPLCLDNVSTDSTLNNMKKNWIKRKCKSFSVDYTAIDTSDVLDIHRYLLKDT